MPEIQRHCPVCHLAEANLTLQKGALRLVRCPRCGMTYANPVPSEFATGQYYDQAGNDYYLTPAKLQSDYSPVRFERELRIFRRHCARGSVLDVGCSSGAFLYQLNARFPGAYSVLGTDVSGPPLDHAESRGVPVLRGDFLGHDWGATRFDAITFWAVLEHLVDPKAFLNKACSLLQPTGVCFLLVPNYRSLATRVLGAKYRYIYPQHLNYFSRNTLTELTRNHFEILELRSTHFNPVVIWQDWRSGGAEVPNEARASLLKKTTTCKQHPLLKPARLLYQGAEKSLAALTLADNLLAVLRPLAR